MPHTVHVNDVPPFYSPHYFPRQFRSLKAAIECAKRAVEVGATMARVEIHGGGELDYRPEQATESPRTTERKRVRT